MKELTYRELLRTDEAFSEWVAQGRRMGFLSSLSELIDQEIGELGHPLSQPHHVHVNFGIQEAVRRIRRLVKDPLSPLSRVDSPPATYGIGRAGLEDI